MGNGPSVPPRTAVRHHPQPRWRVAILGAVMDLKMEKPESTVINNHEPGIPRPGTFCIGRRRWGERPWKVGIGLIDRWDRVTTCESGGGPRPSRLWRRSNFLCGISPRGVSSTSEIKMGRKQTLRYISVGEVTSFSPTRVSEQFDIIGFHLFPGPP